MNKEIMLGDEAVAQAAIDAGISGAYSYPGTPATEIFESVEQKAKLARMPIHARWSANEKVAYEEAMGMSYAGKRALVSFKHVGLNLAADPFMNSAVSGVYGGLVVAVADDPSMHSSQNEQDSRYYADFAHIVCLEPWDQQQAYDMTREAFEVSERFGIPIMVRLVTRLAHSRSLVTLVEPRQPKEGGYSPDVARWTLLPTNARRAYDALLAKQRKLEQYTEAHTANDLILHGNGKPGIIASGISWSYLQEALGEKLAGYNILRIGAYPLPKKKINRLIEESSNQLRVIEEGYPFIERSLTALAAHSGLCVHGKLAGEFPSSGELNSDLVGQAFGLPILRGLQIDGVQEVLRSRPPLLCDGCPHTDSYRAIKEAIQDYTGARVMGDIGCYTLGFYEPHKAIHSCICMGASISMASGISHTGIRPVMCVIGDSTFTHSGITPLLDAARENTDMNVFILDNGIVAMTGGQPPMAQEEELAQLVEGLGVPRAHIRKLNPIPKNHEENVRIIREEIAYPGLSVFFFKRECVTYLQNIKAIQRGKEARNA